MAARARRLRIGALPRRRCKVQPGRMYGKQVSSDSGQRPGGHSPSLGRDRSRGTASFVWQCLRPGPAVNFLKVTALGLVAMLAVGCGSAAIPAPEPSPHTLKPSSSSAPLPSLRCSTSSAKGACGPYVYRQNTASSGYNTYVSNNVWNPISVWQQRLHANSPGDWYVTANMPAWNTAVVSYPSNSQGSSGDGTAPAISSYSMLTSSFSEKMNAKNVTDAEAAYDIWTNSRR